MDKISPMKAWTKLQVGPFAQTSALPGAFPAVNLGDETCGTHKEQISWLDTAIGRVTHFSAKHNPLWRTQHVGTRAGADFCLGDVAECCKSIPFLYISEAPNGVGVGV